MSVVTKMPSLLFSVAVAAGLFALGHCISSPSVAHAAEKDASKKSMRPLEYVLGGSTVLPSKNSSGEAKSEKKAAREKKPEKAPPSPDAKKSTQTASSPEKSQDDKTTAAADKKVQTKASPKKKAGPLSALKEAAELAEKGNREEALKAYRKIIAGADKAKDLKISARARSGSARVLVKMGRENDALAVLKQAIQLNQTLKNARARSLDHLLTGQILQAKARYTQALKSFGESLKILPESEAARKPRLLADMASIQTRLRKFKQALVSYGRLLSLYSKSNKPALVAGVHVRMGELEICRSENRAARAHFKKAETLYRKHGKKSELGRTLLRLAYVDQVLGNTKKAKKTFAESQRLINDNGDLRGSGGLPLLVQGLDEYQTGKILPAVKHLTRSINQFDLTGNRIMAARVRLVLGNLEKDRSRLNAALELGGETLKEFRILADVHGQAGALRLIGEVYYLKGFVHKALEYAQESLAIARKVTDRNQSALARVLLAQIHTGLGDTDFARKLLKEAISDSGAVKKPATTAIVRLAIARFNLQREASQRALKAAKTARQEFAAIGNKRGVADCDNLMGQAHELRGEHDKAFAVLNRALKAHRAVWDRLGEGRDLTALGVHFKNIGNYDKALSYFSQALDLRRGVGNRRGAAANLANIGNLQKHRNKLSDALKSLGESLKIYRQLADKKGEADLLTNIGHVHAARGAYARALEQFTSAMAIHRQIQDYRGMATDLTGMGKVSLAKGDLQSAESYLKEASRINGRLHNPRGELAILVQTATLHQVKEESSLALAFLNKALKKAREIHDTKATSAIHMKMARVYEEIGNHEKARSLFQKTLKMMTDQGDRRGELWALGGLGIIQAKSGDYEEALSNLHRAAQLRSELGLSASESVDLDFHLGEIYEGFKDFERALEHYHKALAMAQIAGTPSVLGKIHDRVGNIYYRMEEYDKAKEFLEDALRLHGETRNISMRKAELIRLGDILSKLGKNEAALDRQLKALKLARETEDVETEARILTRIGTLYQVLGRPRVALGHYREAKEKRTALNDLRGVNENLLQIALVTSILGDFNNAVSDLKKAFHIAQCSEDRSMLWKAYFVMGRALQGKGRLGEALESYRKAITVLEAMEADISEESDEDTFIFGGKTALFETTLRVLMKLARKDPRGTYDNQALRIVEKLKAAEFENTLSRINVENFSDLPRELLIKEKSLKLALRQINARISTQLSQVNPDRKRIEKLIEERRAKEQLFTTLKENLQKNYPSYSRLRYPQPLSVHNLQKSVVDPDEAILEYMVTRSKTHVFAIDKRRFYTYSIDYSRADLERDVTAILRPLHRSETLSGWDPSIAYRLYARLLKPVEAFLRGKKTVTVIPHGPLCSLPFEMLVTSKKHSQKRFWSSTDRPTYLVEKYAFCYAPSIAVLSQLRLRKENAQAGWTMVAFGDALFDDKENARELNKGADKQLSTLRSGSGKSKQPVLRPLPKSRREVSGIAKTLTGPIQTYLGQKATETLFKSADLSRYAYVHLATHGVLLPSGGKQWQRPAVVFSLYGDRENDGFLEMGEVFGLKLNANLVVLSSSLSPKGSPAPDSNGLWGLARAFLFTGTDSIVLGMWPRNDASAADLFTAMYGRLTGGSRAQALREAKIQLLRSPRTSHPYYWASFVLIGNWRQSATEEFLVEDPTKMKFRGLSTWRRLFSM